MKISAFVFRTNKPYPFNTLSEAQLLYKPAENVWSILECLEHIYLINEAVLKVISAPSSPEEKPENDKTELFGEQKLHMLLVTNRAFKVIAPEYVTPKGRFIDKTSAIQNIDMTIDKIISHINGNPIEKETQTLKHPVLGAMTKVDWLHFLISHTNRHIFQITGINTHSDFPAI